ncbi:MAG: hypothetical protein AAF658_20745, partial [Myxococcota bacterium]
MALENKPDLDVLAEIPDQDLADIVAAIREGAKEPGDALGFPPEALETIEQTARAYYRTHQFEKASVIFGFVIQMNMTRATGWRGLGACAQAMREFGIAGQCYKEAIRLDPKDVASRVFLGECMCQVGETR